MRIAGSKQLAQVHVKQFTMVIAVSLRCCLIRVYNISLRINEEYGLLRLSKIAALSLIPSSVLRRSSFSSISFLVRLGTLDCTFSYHLFQSLAVHA